jgi:hypothetical protein
MGESKYSRLFLTEPALRNKSILPEVVAPGSVIESKKHFNSNANFSMSWRYITQPLIMEEGPHAHPKFDQFLCFFGGNLENIFDVDAEIELSLGKEQKVHVIDKATVVYIPKGLIHGPLIFKRVGKPMLFSPISLTPSYYGDFTDNRTGWRPAVTPSD